MTPAESAFLAAGLPRLGVFFQLGIAPPVRLWLGVGGVKPGVNALDDAGALYRGAGELLDVPAFAHLFDGTADRVEFSIAGMPESVLHEIAPQLGDAQQLIQGKPVYVGWCAMGYSWELLGPVYWEWFGFADLIHVRHVGASDAYAPHTVTLALSCGDWMTGRRRAGLSFLTDPDQKRRAAILNPGANPDRFAERVGMYHAGVEKSWPPA